MTFGKLNGSCIKFFFYITNNRYYISYVILFNDVWNCHHWSVSKQNTFMFHKFLVFIKKSFAKKASKKKTYTYSSFVFFRKKFTMNTEDNGNIGLLKPLSSSNEDLSEYTDADESISAPTEFLAEVKIYLTTT